jgi:DNA-binding transcriptional LysR family regulator
MSGLSDLQVFVRVVDAGSFARAAATLGISRSYASKRVRQLEDRLGVRMLHRTTRTLTPTEAGARLHAECAPLLEGISDAEARAMDHRTQPRGTLRLGAPMSFGLRYVAPAVSTFLDRNPEVEVFVDYTDRSVDLVEEGFDLCVRGGPLGDSSLVSRKLAGFCAIAAASPGYLALRGIPARPEDLVEHDCLVYTQRITHDVWPFYDKGGERNVKVSGRLVCNNGDAVVEAALRGGGILYQPDFIVADALARGDLQVVLSKWRGWQSGIWAVWPARRHVSMKVRRFVEHLADHLSPPPWERACAAAGARGPG